MYWIDSAGVAHLIFLHASIYPIMGVVWDSHIYITANDGNIYLMDSIFENILTSADGAVINWTPLAGSNESNIDEAISDDDTTYNSSSTAGHRDTFTHAATGYFAGAVPVPGVNVRARRTATGGATPQLKGIIRLGGVNYLSAAQNMVNDTAYHLHTFNFENNPATSLPWTVAELDAAQFGYELTTAPGAGSIRVTQCYLGVVGTTWTLTDSTAQWLAAGPRRMFKAESTGDNIALKNIDPDLDPLVEANWADEVIVQGDSLAGNNPLVAYQRTAIVATTSGVFGVDEDGKGIRILERYPEPVTTLFTGDPHLYVSHGHGLLRWMPWVAEDCGIEQEILNESPITGKMSALASIGKYIFAVVTPPTGNTQILVGRDRRAGEQGELALGPIIWDTLIETGESVEYSAILGSLAYAGYILGFPQGNDAAYCILPDNGGAPEINDPDYRFAVAAVRYTTKYRFNDWHDKDFPKFDIVGSNLDATTYWEIAYSLDGGSWVTTDGNGNNMRKNTNGLSSFWLASTANASEIQFRFTYTGASNTVAGEINFFEPFAVVRPRQLATYSVTLQLEDDVQHPESLDTRTALTQLSDLLALYRSPDSVTVEAPWIADGSQGRCVVTGLDMPKAEQNGAQEQRITVVLGLQMREST